MHPKDQDPFQHIMHNPRQLSTSSPTTVHFVVGSFALFYLSISLHHMTGVPRMQHCITASNISIVDLSVVSRTVIYEV